MRSSIEVINGEKVNIRISNNMSTKDDDNVLEHIKGIMKNLSESNDYRDVTLVAGNDQQK